MASVIKLYSRGLNTAFTVLGINEQDVKYNLDIKRMMSHLQIEDMTSNYKLA